MAHKQQKTSPKKSGLEEIHRRRVALEERLRQIQQQIALIRKEFVVLKDERVVQQHRRKLRYPAT